MKIWSKKWDTQYKGHAICLECITYLSLKTQGRFYVDGVLCAETKPGWSIGRELEWDVHCRLEGKDAIASILVGYDKTGLKLTHQLLIDDQFVSGERIFQDYYDHLPDKTLLWYMINYGIGAGVSYAVLMILFNQVDSFKELAFLFFFFSMTMGTMFYLMSRLGRKKGK